MTVPMAPVHSTIPRSAEPARSLTGSVAIVVSRFPKLTETFILREIEALSRSGIPILLVPLIRHRDSTVHELARSWSSRALWTPWFDRSVVRSCWRWMREKPASTIRAVGSALAVEFHGPARLLKVAALVPKALHIARLLDERGIPHVHAHFATHPATIARLVASLTGATYSVTVHAHDIFVDTRGLGTKLQGAAFVRCISRFNARHLERELDTDVRLEVVRLGVDPDRYSTARKRRGTAATILCVAALRPYKGIDVLLDACARLDAEGRDFELELIGDGPQRDDLQRRAESLGISDRTRWRGGMTEGQVIERLGEADIAVHPSVVAPNGQMDGIPVALMEAMAAGLPVVASRLSGIPELVRSDRDGLLVTPGRADELASALGGLLDDPGARERLGREGRRRVESAFDVHRNTEQLARLLVREARVDDSALVRRLPDLGIAGPLALLESRSGDDARVEIVECRSAERERTLVLKAHATRPKEASSATERAEREHRMLARARERLADAPHLHVPRVEAREREMLVLEHLPGQRLDALLRDHALHENSLRSSCRLAGEWLREFHGRGPDPQPFDRARARELLEAPLVLLDRAREVFGRAGTDRASAAVRLLAEELCNDGGARPTVIHGDFWPGNVLARQGSVSVLDFEGARAGLAAYDVEYFRCHVELLVRRRSRLRVALDAFDSGLTWQQHTTWNSWGRLATAATLGAVAARRDSGRRRRRWLRRLLADGLESAVR